MSCKLIPRILRLCGSRAIVWNRPLRPERGFWSMEAIRVRDGSMFAILWENVLRIKRVQPLGKGVCRLFSDNPAFAQDSIQMSEKDGTFSTVGRVIGVMRKF